MVQRNSRIPNCQTGVKQHKSQLFDNKKVIVNKSWYEPTTTTGIEHAHACANLPLLSLGAAVRFPLLLVKKVEIRLWNAVLLFSTTVYWEDAGSKIQFSLISVYKNWDKQPQSLGFVEARPLMKLTWNLNHSFYCFWPLIDVDFQFICLRKQHSKFFTKNVANAIYWTCQLFTG